MSQTRSSEGDIPSLSMTHGSFLFWIAFAVFLTIQCIPFLITVTPPLLDYPNHLARVFILSHWATDPFLHAYYQPSWAALPNLAFDGIGVALNAVLPIYRVGQVALLSAVVLLASGLVVLSIVLHGRPKPFCLLGFLFLFSEPFAWGFLNLIFGFALVLWGIAIWLRLRAWRLPLVLIWSVPFALVLFFTHLFAFGSYAVTVACIELAMARTEARSTVRPFAAYKRAVLTAGTQFVLPIAVFLLASPTPLGRSSTQYGSLLDRVRALPLAPVRNFSDVSDVLTVTVVATLLVLGLWTRRLRIAKEMRFALAMLALLCIAIPHTLSSSETAEIRLPVIAMLLLTASGDWKVKPWERTPMLATGAALSLLFVARTVTTVEAFARGSRFVADMRQTLAEVPQGARIASVTVTTPTEYRVKAEWQHAICYEVIDKSAFVPSIFTNAGQQPLLLGSSFRDKVFPPSHYVSRPGEMLPASRFAEVDYVVIINPDALQARLPDTLQLIAERDQFRLYRVRG